MRSTHAPKACITGEACITHEVRITFRKERITQKSPFCLVDKRDFFVGAGDEARTRYLHLGKVALYRMSYTRGTNGIIADFLRMSIPFFKIPLWIFLCFPKRIGGASPPPMDYSENLECLAKPSPST